MEQWAIRAYGLDDMASDGPWRDDPAEAVKDAAGFAEAGFDWIYLVRRLGGNGEGELVAFDGVAYDLPDFEQYLSERG